MVEAIAGHQGCRTPTFLVYLFRFNLHYLLPVLMVVWWFFFR